MLFIKIQILVIILAMIFFIILLSTINLSRSDELNNNFKINDKDIIKFTRDDAKDVIIIRDDNKKALSINPIIPLKRSEIINATLNQLLLQSPVSILTSTSEEIEIPNLTNEENTGNIRPPNVVITKGIVTRSQDLEADQVPLPVKSFPTVNKNVEKADGQLPTPKVYFPPIQDNVQLQQFKRDGAVGDSLLAFTTKNYQDDKLEENESIFISQDNNKLTLQTLGLVGLLNLNNYFGITTTSPLQKESDIASNDLMVSIPNAVLPLEPHNSQEPQSVADGDFFVQPKDVDEQYDYDQPTNSFEPAQDYALEPKNFEDYQPEINVLAHEESQSQFIGNNEPPAHENNQQRELNAANIQQIQTEGTNVKSEIINGHPLQKSFGPGTFLLSQHAVSFGAEQIEEKTNLHPSTSQGSRSRAINNSQQNSLLPEQSIPNDQLTQKPKKLTWQSVQSTKVSALPHENSNSDVNELAAKFQTGPYNSFGNLNPPESTSNPPDNASQLDLSSVISLQPPGMLPYFTPLSNKATMVPPNFNQPINNLPEVNVSDFPRQPSQPVKWTQQNNKLVQHTAIGNQQFNILEKPNKSNHAQQVFMADFLPETTATTSVPSPPTKSVYTLKEHRTIADNTQGQQSQLRNTPPHINKPDDDDGALLQNEQEILNFLRSQVEFYDSQSQEQPIQFFPEPRSTENDQLSAQSLGHSLQSQNNVATAYQPATLEQALINENTNAQIEGATRYDASLVQPTEGIVQAPKLDSISLETDNSEEIVLILSPPKQDYERPVEITAAKTETCLTSTVIQEKFVTVTAISKILETVREPISTSYVTIRDHQTFTRTVQVPYVTNTVTKYIENQRCSTSQPSATRTYGRSLMTNTKVLNFPPRTSSYTDYFGDGNSRETLKKTLDGYENDYMEWVDKLKSRHFHIDKNGKPNNLMSLSYGEWPKHFVIDERFWE